MTKQEQFELLIGQLNFIKGSNLFASEISTKVTESMVSDLLCKCTHDIKVGDLKGDLDIAANGVDHFIAQAAPEDIAILVSYLFWKLNRYTLLIDDLNAVVGDVKYMSVCEKQLAEWQFAPYQEKSAVLWLLCTTPDFTGACDSKELDTLHALTERCPSIALRYAQALIFYHNVYYPCQLVKDVLPVDKVTYLDVREDIVDIMDVIECGHYGADEVITLYNKTLSDLIETYESDGMHMFLRDLKRILGVDLYEQVLQKMRLVDM